MNAGLGRERTIADIRRVAIRGFVQDFIQHPAGVREIAKFVRRDARLKCVGKFALQQQRRNDRRHVGVAAALAEAIQRALNLPATGAHRHQRIGNGIFGIVMRVNTEMDARHVMRDIGDDALDFVGQRAAVGIA